MTDVNCTKSDEVTNEFGVPQYILCNRIYYAEGKPNAEHK